MDISEGVSIIKTGYKVSDAMTRKPISVAPDRTIYECSKIMLQNHVGSMLVVVKGELNGILTEQDIVRKVVAKGLDPKNTTVKDIMITNLITMQPDADIYDALVLMRDRNIRHLPIMHKKEMLGYLTIKDILKIEPELFELLVEKFELREESTKPVIGEETMPEGICEMCGQHGDRLYHLEGILYCDSCKPEQ